MGKPLISAGDVIGFYPPSFLTTGNPGHGWKPGIVLGLEVDPYKDTINGLWMCGLSDRTDKVRPWDCLITGDQIAGSNGVLNEGEWVARTHIINLLPVTKDFFGQTVRIKGHVVAEALLALRDKLDEGQCCNMYSSSLGPRPKLPQTVAKVSLSSHQSYDYFDYDALLSEASRGTHPLSSKEHEYTLALRDSEFQRSELALEMNRLLDGTPKAKNPFELDAVATINATKPTFSKDLA